MATVNIKGIDKARLLHALVKNGRPLGLGVLQARPFSLEEAQEWINKGLSHDVELELGKSFGRKLRFDYVTGVPIKCDLSGDEVDPWGYDRDQGEGAFERVVASLR